MGEWTRLPAAGREGEPPEWPLPGQTLREEEMWARLWVKPQAVMWERYGQEYEVALYVRRFCEAEEIDSKVNLSTLVRQMGDALGLSTPGLRANRWRIPRPEEEPGAETGASTGAPAGVSVPSRSSKSRLKVVPPPADGD